MGPEQGLALEFPNDILGVSHRDREYQEIHVKTAEHSRSGSTFCDPFLLLHFFFFTFFCSILYTRSILHRLLFIARRCAALLRYKYYIYIYVFIKRTARLDFPSLIPSHDAFSYRSRNNEPDGKSTKSNMFCLSCSTHEQFKIGELIEEKKNNYFYFCKVHKFSSQSLERIFKRDSESEWSESREKRFDRAHRLWHLLRRSRHRPRFFSS